MLITVLTTESKLRSCRLFPITLQRNSDKFLKAQPCLYLYMVLNTKIILPGKKAKTNYSVF